MVGVVSYGGVSVTLTSVTLPSPRGPQRTSSGRVVGGSVRDGTLEGCRLRCSVVFGHRILVRRSSVRPSVLWLYDRTPSTPVQPRLYPSTPVRPGSL